MANTFTYANLPGYGSASASSSYVTGLQKQRMGYWTGEKPQLEFDLNKLYTNRFKNLSMLKSADLQNIHLDQQKKKQVEHQIKQGFVTTMGGHKKGSLWRDPASYQWWNPTGGEFAPTPKWIANTGKPVIPGTQATKVIGGETFIKNPNWNASAAFKNFSSKAASSGFGQAGAAFAGTPASVLGMVGTGIQMVGGDNDPGTYTGTERFGDALSYGATAAKVAGMINPVLSIPAFLVAAYFGSKSGEGDMEEYNKAKQEWKDKRDKMETDWRRSQRNLSKIGGTSPLDMNWWRTTYS